MKDFLNAILFLLKLFFVTFIFTACFAGLYGLVYYSAPRYKGNHERLKADAVDWGLKMTFILYGGFVLMLMNSSLIREIATDYPEGLASVFFSFVALLIVGFISSFFTVAD